ncbi:hypothetical protein [Alicyclobacillus sp. ALC3]|uniref:hypothetical protein n=1 Tax=Alicyclobacillus sp. ALC3 TaxID=2796143 RepID=UPI002377E8FC|nr:hypothetical protein [Alicyclobacillus sp. ALC3]WDL95241.1 hypothetical protein JC200_12520 [Alicyclobacillus sp. ALC3]
MSSRALFIHSGMRTGSTYLLHRFRVLPTAMAFTEPFNEVLAQMNAQLLRGLGPAYWNSGHSATDPYYAEYEPLLDPSAPGIRGFRPEFTFDNFFRVNDDLPEQRSYLKGLLDLAEQDGRVPVLGFCASLGRVEWLKRNFPDAYHLVLIRNPVQQWISSYSMYTEQKNAYFVNSYRRMMLSPGDSEYLAEVRDAFKESLEATDIRIDRLYEIFAHVYAWSTCSAVPHADLVVDIDRLSSSPAYRDYITETIRAQSGQQVDFSDSRVSNHNPGDIPIDFYRINSFVSSSIRQWLRRHPLPVVEQSASRGYEYHPNSVLEKLDLSVAPLRQIVPAEKAVAQN